MKKILSIILFMLTIIPKGFGYDKSINLLENGNFFNGLFGWTVNDTGGKIWVENNICHITAGTSSSSWSYYTCSVSQTLKLTPGKYKCSFNYLGTFSDGGGYKIFRIITSDDDIIDTTDTYLVDEAKNKGENFSPEYTFTIFEDKYVMVLFSLMVHYGNMTLSNCLLTRETMFLEPEAKSYEREYGDNNPEFEVIYNGMVEGDENLLANNIKVDFSCEANKFSDIGSYPIKISTNGVAPGYEIKRAIEGSLKVINAPITVSCNDLKREYGEENPVPQIIYTGFKNDQNENIITKYANYRIDANTNSNVGSYKIQLYGAEAPNYKFVYKDVYMEILKAPLSAQIINAERLYGDNNPNFSMTYFGLKNNESSPTWIRQPKFQTEAVKFSNVGDYIVEAIDYESNNYNIEHFENGILTVLPTNLIFSGNNQSRLYYEPNPSFSYKVTGFKNNDDSSIITITPVLTSTADISSDCGKYEIIISDAKLSNNNYNIIYQNSTLTINPRNLNVFVEDCERPYGQKNPDFQLSYDGFVNNQNEEVLVSLPKAFTNASASSNVGTYSIDISGGEALNYKFKYSSGKLIIIKADQTIVWNQDFTHLSVGQQIELTAYSSSGLPITYELGDNNICEIYSVGNKKYLDCIKEGEIQIRASQVGNINYNATTRTSKQVIIKGQFVPANSISLNYTKLTLNEGESFQLSAKLEPSTATQTFFWSSSNNNVVTVNDDGYITGITPGNAIITVTNGDISATCEIDIIGNAGVHDIVNDSIEIEVYNLQGIKLNIHSRDELYKLKRGIYIINGKKELVF